MTRSLFFLAAFVSLFVPGACSTARAVDALDVIPVDASLVVRLQAPNGTIADLAAFVNGVQPGFGVIIQSQGSAIGIGIGNPTLAGVDMDKDWYLALFANSGREPDVVLVIPTTDAKALQDGVGTGFSFANSDGYVAYSRSKAAINSIESCVTGKSAAISSIIDKQNLDLLNAGHLTTFVNGQSLKTVYANELANAGDQLEDFIDAIASQVPAANSQSDLAYVWDMYREMGHASLQAVQDSKCLTVSVKFTQETMQIDELLTLVADSATDRFIGRQPLSDMALMKSVPEDQMVYWGFRGDVDSLIDYAEKIMSSVPVDESYMAHYRKSFEIMRDAKFGSIVGGGDLKSGDGGAMKYFGINEVSPASKIREAFSFMRNEVEIEIGGMKQRQSYKPDAEKIEGLSVDLFTMQQEMPPELDPLGVQKVMNEKMYGPDGMVQRLVTKGDVLYQTMGDGNEAMRKLLTAPKWSDDRLLMARSRLPEKANLLTLIDLPSMVHRFAQVIISTGTLPVPIKAEMLDDLQLDRSYAGFSVLAEPQRISIRSTIPVETFKGFMKIGQFVQQLQAGGI